MKHSNVLISHKIYPTTLLIITQRKSDKGEEPGRLLLESLRQTEKETDTTLKKPDRHATVMKRVERLPVIV